jgi:hypothetical protein
MDSLLHFYYSLRPLIFDLAGLSLIFGVITYIVYIRCGIPWVAKTSAWFVGIGAIPIGLMMMSGYFGS